MITNKPPTGRFKSRRRFGIAAVVFTVAGVLLWSYLASRSAAEYKAGSAMAGNRSEVKLRMDGLSAKLEAPAWLRRSAET